MLNIHFVVVRTEMAATASELPALCAHDFCSPGRSVPLAQSPALFFRLLFLATNGERHNGLCLRRCASRDASPLAPTQLSESVSENERHELDDDVARAHER